MGERLVGEAEPSTGPTSWESDDGTARPLASVTFERIVHWRRRGCTPGGASLPSTDILNTDVIVNVWSDDELLGELRISRGTID